MTCLIVGNSSAQTLETLVMPGPVAEAHAEIETECAACHAPFDRSEQTGLCIDCHEDVGADIADGVGFHGRDLDASEQRCATCHTDHEGRDAVIVILDEQSFDHDLTDFPLVGGHRDPECEACHAPDVRHRDAPTVCIDCHREDDVHDGFTGEACDTCHKETDWLEVRFDHDLTDYPLLGRHQEVGCINCHEDKTFRFTETTCFGCHQDDDAHEGRSGEQCETCHNPTDWTNSIFDHARDTRFSLDGRHGELACNDCHSGDPFADVLAPACVSCHLDDDNHDGHFGSSCDTCHGNDDFAEINFDHDRDTEHALVGAHKPLACESCHVEPIYDVALPSGCLSCHEEDDPHAGEQGGACNDCHNEHDWIENVFFDHDLTSFPLLGLHAEQECDACHESRVFRDAPENCVDCHRDDDTHNGRFADQCATCHNPVDWTQWQFDHDRQTDFELTGAHVDLLCEACHRQSLASMSRLGDACGDCHRNDDIHDGEFGSDCGRCHAADSFSNVREIQ